MRYQRFRPWQTFEEDASHVVKLDYRHLWYDKLRKSGWVSGTTAR